jgi:glycosyltransferase involved in cell wall biosynthesis
MTFDANEARDTRENNMAVSASPKLSIMMPFKDSGQYIREAISSVLADGQLDCEVLAIDDQSTDESWSVVQNYSDERLKPVKNKRSPGHAGALNTGLDEVRGQYIGLCDSDDRRSSSGLITQTEFLDRHPEFIAVCGGYIAFADHSGKLSSLNSSQDSCEITDELLSGHARTSLCTYLIRRGRIDDLRFRDWFESAVDADFQYRLAELGRVYFLRGCYYEWRIRDSSMTHQQDNRVRQFFSESAKEFRLQRARRGQDDLELGSPPPVPEAARSGRNSAAEHAVSLLVGAAWDDHRQGRRADGLRKMVRAMALQPLRPSLWKGFIALLVKPRSTS